MYKLSLCIATNGIVEWVSKVLDSIYYQNCDETLYEVVITDNGNNVEFQNLVLKYQKTHNNFKYVKTKSNGFMNIIDSFDYASGEFLKFINHRFEFLPGTLQYLIDFVIANSTTKPYVYFANGVIKGKKDTLCFNNFDSFINKLGIYTSWSAGISLWKSDYMLIPKDTEYNETYPNTSLLFYNLNKDNFKIDNHQLFRELPTTEEGKGVYDFFGTFSIEFVELLEKFYLEGRISRNTFESIKNENLDFLAKYYYLFILKKVPCSYILEGYEEKINKYYSMPKLLSRMYKVYINIGKDIISKIRKKLWTQKK